MYAHYEEYYLARVCKKVNGVWEFKQARFATRGEAVRYRPEGYEGYCVSYYKVEKDRVTHIAEYERCKKTVRYYETYTG